MASRCPLCNGPEFRLVSMEGWIVVSDNMHWKDWPLHRLGVTQSLIDACEEDGIFTIGQALDSEDYREDDEFQNALASEQFIAARNAFYEHNPDVAQREEDESDAVAHEDALTESDIRLKHHKLILESNARWVAAEAKALAAKNVAVELRKAADVAGKATRNLIARGPDPQRELPFAEEADDDAVDGSFEVSDWDQEEIGAALGLTAKQLEKLHEADITTMGEFETLRAGAGLMSIKGIGRALADQLEDRALQWLDDNRDHLGASVLPIDLAAARDA